jgi:hypothetical protein
MESGRIPLNQVPGLAPVPSSGESALQGSRSSTPATLQTGNDPGTIGLPQPPSSPSNRTQRYLRPEIGPRLPSVQQLLMPQNVPGSNLSVPSRQNSPATTQPFPLTTASPGISNFLQPPKRTSDGSIRSPLSSQYDAPFSGSQFSHHSGISTPETSTHRTSDPTQTKSQSVFSPLESSIHRISDPTQEKSQQSIFSPLETSLHRASDPTPARSQQAFPPSPGKESLYGSQPFSGHTAQHYPWSLPSAGSLRQIQHEDSRTTSGQQLRPPDTQYHATTIAQASPLHQGIGDLDWAVTKAGRPRKRLARACMSCRQKKIRCPPNPTRMKCFQCEKTDSLCVYKDGCVHREKS